MSKMTDQPRGEVSLRPHQLALIEKVLQAPRPSTIVARWATGSGKTLTAIKIIEALLQQAPTSRILVLVSTRVEQDHFAQALRHGTMRTERMDRFVFRALQDLANDRHPNWEAGTSYVFLEDFAAESDVLNVLAEVPWDLIIAFDAGRSDGGLEHVMRGLAEEPSMARLLVFGERAIGNPRSPTFESAVRFDEVLRVADAGTRARAQLRVVHVQPDEDEKRLGLGVHRLIEALQQSQTEALRRWGASIARQAQSSQAALEDSLRGLKLTVTLGNKGDFEALDRADEPSSIAMHLEQRENLLVADRVDECLRHLELVREDSKLTALHALVKPLLGAGNASICVFSSYRGSLFYVRESLVALNVPVHTMHAGMAMREQSDEFNGFLSRPGMLVTTPMMLQGLEVPDVDAVIFFDLPPTRSELLLSISRFTGSGREILPFHVFAPDDSFGPVADAQHQLSEMSELLAHWY